MPEITVPLRLPELGEGVWLQGGPLSLAEARGRVVLVDFWEATCIHCLRTLPYLVEWHHRYAPRGLLIVGVHTPEFEASSGRETAAAVAREHGLEYPILLDDRRQTWDRFANKVWPAKYLADARGYLRWEHVGEGAYEAAERFVQTLLAEAGDREPFPDPMPPVRFEDAPGQVCHRPTPELHLGYHRGKLVAAEGYQPERRVLHEGDLREPLAPGVFTARGGFFHAAEYLETETEGAEIELVCEAAGVYAVAEPVGGEGELEIELDGSPVPAELAGADVAHEGGRAMARFGRLRTLSLVESELLAHRRLLLRFPGPGRVRLYTLSFTGCPWRADAVA